MTTTTKSAAIEEINPVPPTILKSARANEIHQSVEREQQKQWVNGKGTAEHLRNITKQNITKQFTKHHETKHHETNEIKRRNLRTAPQTQAHRMGCTAQNWTLPALHLSQVFQHRSGCNLPRVQGCKGDGAPLFNGVSEA